MVNSFDPLIAEIKADIRGFQASLQQAASSVKRFDRETSNGLNGFQMAVTRARLAILSLGGAWAAFRFGKGIIDAAMQMQALENKMKAAAGDAKISGEALAYVRAEANRLGLELRSATDGYAGFLASGLRAGLTFKQTQDIFSGVSEAAVSMRLSVEQSGLIFKALEQIAGKGVVSMEELRGQLGDALPGAFEIAAKAMGKTTAEFSKMVANGEVMSSDFLPKFGLAIRKELGGSSEEASRSAQAAFNRLENAIFDMNNRLASSGFLDAVTDGVKDLTTLLNDPSTQEGLTDFAKLLGDIATASVTAASHLGTLYSKISNVIDKAGDSAFRGLFGEAGYKALQQERFNSAHNLPVGSGPMEFGPSDQYKGDPALEALLAQATGGGSGKYTLGTKSQPTVNAAAQRAASVRERLRQQVKEQNLGLITEQDRDKVGSARAMASLEKRHEEEQALLEKALKQKAITQQEFNESSLKVELDYQARLAEIRQQYREQFLSDQEAAAEGFLGVQIGYQNKSLQQQGQSFRSSIQQAAQHNRAFFALEKAAAIAQALLSARQSVVDAYKFGNAIGGPALGAAFAGVAAAAQAANIAAIASTSYGGGGGSVSSSGGAVGVGGTDSSGSAPGTALAPTQNVYITLQGDEDALFSMNTVRKLIERFNDATAAGTRLNVVLAN